MWTAIDSRRRWSSLGAAAYAAWAAHAVRARRTAVAARRRPPARLPRRSRCSSRRLVHRWPGCFARGAGRTSRSTLRRASRMFCARIRGARAARPRMIFYRWLMPRSAARAGSAAGPAAARRRLQRRRVDRIPAATSTRAASVRSMRCPTGRRSRRSNTSRTSWPRTIDDDRRRHRRAAGRAGRRTAWAASSRAPICGATARRRCAG